MSNGETLHINPEHLTVVRDMLSIHLPGREVWAFGSRVTGKAKKFSDLDLVVIGETPLSLSVLADVKEAFAESDLPYKVDIVDWATTSEAFRRIIEHDHIVIQRK